MPSISLVITVYNRERYLAAAIESILASSYQDFELLIWDDGSTDKSVEIARKYASADKRVYVVAAPHLGRGQALSDAHREADLFEIASTQGKYLGWVDSDDLLAPTALSESAIALDTQPDVGMVYTDYTVINEWGKELGLGNRCQIPYSPARLLIDFMTFHFRLMRREIYNFVGGVNPEFSTIEDYELCLRLSEVTEIEHIKKSLYMYRVHRDSICYNLLPSQISLTEKAINQALQRRGLADRFELEVQLRPKFVLRKKESSENCD